MPTIKKDYYSVELDMAPATYRSGAVGLWTAVIQDVFTVQGLTQSRQRLIASSARRQVEKDVLWLMREDDEPSSFLWACHHVGVDPERIASWEG